MNYSAIEEMKQALREAPRTRDKIAAERMRVRERATCLQRLGLNQTQIAARLSVSRRYLARCLCERGAVNGATMAVDGPQTSQDLSTPAGCAPPSSAKLGPS